MMFSILPLNIGDAFCFICLPKLTDVATNDDRTTEATRESVFFVFRWSFHPRRVLNSFGLWPRPILSFFLRRVHFVHSNDCWAQSVAQNSSAVFTRFIFLFLVVCVLHMTIIKL